MARYRVLWMSFLVALLAVGCVSPTNTTQGSSPTGRGPTTAAKKTIVVVARGEPVILNHQISSNRPGAVAGITELMYALNARLANVQDYTRVVGTRLADVAPTTDNGLWKLSPDGTMETTWKLRRDATWHDGKPFTAEDMLFTFQVGRDKEVAALRNEAYDSLESAAAPDPYTFVLTWNKTFILADAFVGDMEPLPKHLLEAAYHEDKVGFPDIAFFTREPVGTGPFKLTDWVLNSHLTLTAFDAYPLGRAKIDEIQWKFILDTNVMIANVLAGAANMTIGRGISLQQSLEARDRLAGQGKPDYYSLGWVALFPQFINPNPAVIADVRFRRALLHTLDRQELAEVILGGTVPVVANYVNPSQPEFAETMSAVVRQEYDVRKAAQLVEELGYTKRPDGFYYNAAGEILWSEIRTTAEDDLKDSLMFATADQWKSFGVDSRPLHIPRQMSTDLEYRATRPGFEMTRQPDDFSDRSLKRLLSREASVPANTFRGQNRGRYMSPELDSLIERYLVTVPMRERLEIGRGIVKHMTENLPVMGVAYDSTAIIIGASLTNVNALELTRNVHQWDVRV